MGFIKIQVGDRMKGIEWLNPQHLMEITYIDDEYDFCKYRYVDLDTDLMQGEEFKSRIRCDNEGYYILSYEDKHYMREKYLVSVKYRPEFQDEVCDYEYDLGLDDYLMIITEFQTKQNAEEYMFSINERCISTQNFDDYIELIDF